MRGWFSALDDLLRGRTTHLSNLRTGRLVIPLRGFFLLILLLGATYGLCMGTYSLLRTHWAIQLSHPAGSAIPKPPNDPEWRQLVASAVKVPSLYLLTLAVTFPSLYVFSALVGSRLSFTDVLKLLIGGIAVSLAVLASFGPIVAFFSLSTSSYPFMVLLNVVMFAIAGLLGLSFLLQTLHRIHYVGTHQEPEGPPVTLVTPPIAPGAVMPAGDVPPAGPEPVTQTVAPPPTEPIFEPLPGVPPSSPQPKSAADIWESMEGPLEMPEGHLLGGHEKLVFRCWLVVFGLVGAQMSWILRPFIGNPDEPFTWFRPRNSNFFEAIWHAFLSLFQFQWPQ